MSLVEGGPDAETVDDEPPIDPPIDRPVDPPADAFVQLYQRRYADLVRLAYVLVDSNEQAEELVQEAFARTYLRWDTTEHPDAYVRTVLVNACRDVLRRRRIERRLSLRHDAPEPAAAAAADEHDYLDDALATLPSRERVALVLKHYEGLDEAAIAEAMGCPRGTVKSLIHRGTVRLRGQISP